MIAERRTGRPLQFDLRLTIKRLLREGSSRRRVAKSLGLAKRTVDKYAPKNL